MANLHKLLQGKTAKERANIKGKKIAKQIKKGVFEHGDVFKINIVDFAPIDGGIQVFAQAWKNGEQIGFGKDGTVDVERFRFFNPPILVEDLNGGIKKEFIEDRGEPNEVIKIRSYSVNPQKAIQEALYQAISPLAHHDSSKIVSGSIGNTVSTFYPDADPESTSFDGSVGRTSVSEAWSTIRSGAGNNSNDNITSLDEPGLRVSTTNASEWRTINRTFLLFDTSAIPDTDTIDSAILSIYVTSLTNTITPSSGTMGFRIVTTTPASNTGISNSDYGNTGTVAQANDILIGDITTSAYNDFTLNATGLSNISKTGVSKFGIRHTRDADDSEPTGSHSIGQKSTLFPVAADTAGTSQDPKLVVTHSAASTSAPTVTTQAVSSIAATTATGNGNVTDDGGATITERGVCWAASTGPTTADSTATSAGTTGAFTASMTGLTAGTEYFVRAYATNSEGTSYGAEVTFTTDAVPDAFVIGDWTLTDLASSGDARIAITTLPADNGAALTDLEYKKDAGAWTSLGGTATGNYDLSIFTDGVSANIQIRAVNAVGNGADSDTKSVTTTAAATAPAQFATDGWSVADRATDGAIRITITTLPDDGGSAITDLEYQLDAGSWVTMGTTTTGTFDITGLTNGQEYDVAVRAVNSVGNGTASATKAVTPTLAPAFTAAATDVIYVLDVSDTTNSTAGELKPVTLEDLKTYFTA